MDLKKHEIAIAAGRDAGNRAMSRAGRKAWSVDDWNVAARDYLQKMNGKLDDHDGQHWQKLEKT